MGHQSGEIAATAHAETLSPNHSFLLDYSLTNFRTGKILDYGCGAASIVAAGLRAGLDIYGVEVFYGGGSTKAAVQQKGLFGTKVFEIQENGLLPFEENSFDLVFNDQVFEHVKDLGTTLKQLHRVIKPGGTLVSLFPSMDVWREGHCGIPFAHRLPSNSWLAYSYLLVMRCLGLGHHKGNKSRRQWAKDFAQWLHDYCFYRSRNEIRAAFREAGFETKHIEFNYILYRLPQSRIAAISWVLPLPFANTLSAWLCRKLGGMVLLSTKVSQLPGA
jgi:SAM-dependent methyltransferase